VRPTECSRSCAASRTPYGPDEIELRGLLGRLVATAVQNIRSYEAERGTVEELRRLSALRADFSLPRLARAAQPDGGGDRRGPDASGTLGASSLRSSGRSFLALISDETSRLATLIGDVLDTSRIDAGTFTYSFSDVDLAELVREAVAAIGLGQDEVSVVARPPECSAGVCAAKPRAAEADPPQPDRERGQVLAVGRARRRQRVGPTTAACWSPSRIAGPGSRASSRA